MPTGTRLTLLWPSRMNDGLRRAPAERRSILLRMNGGQGGKRSIVAMPFDPEAPLPGAPDPWAPSSMPALRSGPPYLMTEMIAAEPALAERLAGRLGRSPAFASLTDALRSAAVAREPIIVTGCGTSEHAAVATAVILADALADAGLTAETRSVQAFESLRSPSPRGLLVAISHEGGTWATNEALSAANAAGARTALITVSDRSPGAALSEIVVATDEQDQSWCHTVGYLSPLVVAASVAAALGGTLVTSELRAVLRLADHAPTAASAAEGLTGCDRLLAVGSGIDFASARELALKIEEGAHLPATAHQLEAVRHGHLATANDRTGLVLILVDTAARGSLVLDRALAVLRSAAALGMPAVAILAGGVAEDVPAALTPAGRLVVPLASGPPRPTQAALGAAIPLQLLAERLARARGVNPDTLGREDPRQAAAAAT